MVELLSPLAPDECESRLRAATDRGGPLARFGLEPVVGRVSGGSVRLRKRIAYSNSFQTVLTGSLEGHGGGTIFRGRAGLHPLVTAFMTAWIGVVATAGAACVVAVLVALAGRNRVGFAGIVFFIPLLLLLAMGVGIARYARWLARGEEAFLVSFVAEVIAAGRPPDAEPGTSADCRV